MGRGNKQVSRKDAVRNREHLIAATRQVLYERGVTASLQAIAEDAGVTRTTLHRHFSSREDLIARVVEDDIRSVEDLAKELSPVPDGVIWLYRYVLDMQLANPALYQSMARGGTEELRQLNIRLGATFTPLLAAGRDSGLVHPGVTTSDVMRTFMMGALLAAEAGLGNRPGRFERIHALMHRALFTTPPPEMQ